MIRSLYVPFALLGGLAMLKSLTLSRIARLLNATTAQVALAWLLRRAPNMLLIPGTSPVTHLRENIAAAELSLPDTAVEALGAGAGIVHSSSEHN
jgi:pyridoxine 4-dehydrogenase